MKIFASATLGAIALATLGFAQPAAARSDVGVYVGPGGVGVSVDTYRSYCRDDRYRRDHWNYCSRFYGNGSYYQNGYDSDRDRRHRHHDDRDDRRDRDNHRDRDDHHTSW